MRKKLLTVALAASMVLSNALAAFAADDVTYYFVDCGDYTVDTITPGADTTDDTRDDNDNFGIYQSVTDQAYSADATTGKSWGIVANAYTGAAYEGLGVRLDGAWAFEYNEPSSNIHRNWSNTYSNGTPAGHTPTLTWKFELPAGTYNVEVCAVNPWNNCSNVTIKGNDTTIGTIDSIAVTNGGASDIETKYGGQTVSGSVTVGADGVLTVVATNGNDNSAANQCVNIGWIKITGKAVDTTTTPTTNTNTDTNTNANNTNTSTPDTGDSSAVMLFLTIAVASAAVVLKRKTVIE